MGSQARRAALCEDRVRPPAVPGCRCPARPAPPAGGRAGAAARTWHRGAGRTWTPSRDRPGDPCLLRARRRLPRRRTAGQTLDRHAWTAACPRNLRRLAGQAGRRAACRPRKTHRADRHQHAGATQYPELHADQHQNPGTGHHPEPRAGRNQNPGPGRRPEPGASPHRAPRAGRYCDPQAGRSRDPGWCPKDCANPERRADRRQNPGAHRCPGSGAGRHRDPGAGRSQGADPRPRLPPERNAPPHADPSADRGTGSTAGPGRPPGPCRPRPCRARCRQGAGHRGAGRRSGAGQARGGNPRGGPAGTARQGRPGYPGQDPDRCRWRTSASAGPERAQNRRRSYSLSSPRTPRWLPPRPVGSHSIMKHQPLPRPHFAPAAARPAIR
jgi:hypothetical protein